MCNISFYQISKRKRLDQLNMICEREGIKCEEQALSQIYDATSGDLRHSINILQGRSRNGFCLPISTVVASIGLSGKTKVGEIIKMALTGKFNDARIKLLELTNVYGMSETDFLKYANQESYNMKLDCPGEFASLIAEYDYRLAAGAHPEIQLSAFLAQLGKLGSKKEKT